MHIPYTDKAYNTQVTHIPHTDNNTHIHPLSPVQSSLDQSNIYRRNEDIKYEVGAETKGKWIQANILTKATINRQKNKGIVEGSHDMIHNAINNILICSFVCW